MNLSEIAEILGKRNRGQPVVAATAAMDVMDRLEAFVAGSYELELALKKQKERNRTIEGELAAVRLKYAESVEKENQVTRAHAADRENWQAQAARYQEHIKKVSEQLNGAQRQVGFLNATLTRHQNAWEKFQERETRANDLAVENKALSERVATYQGRIQELERAHGEEKARNQQLMESLVSRVDLLRGAVGRLTEDSAQRMGKLEKILTNLWLRLAAPKKTVPTPPPFTKR